MAIHSCNRTTKKLTANKSNANRDAKKNICKSREVTTPLKITLLSTLINNNSLYTACQCKFSINCFLFMTSVECDHLIF